ncbi:putative nucleic acid-binding protein [Bradyrhizobium sp. USDA 4448]
MLAKTGLMDIAALHPSYELALALSVDADVWTTHRDFAGWGVASWSTPSLMRACAAAN